MNKMQMSDSLLNCTIQYKLTDKILKPFGACFYVLNMCNRSRMYLNLTSLFALFAF
jgi:hypothetical protein